MGKDREMTVYVRVMVHTLHNRRPTGGSCLADSATSAPTGPQCPFAPTRVWLSKWRWVPSLKGSIPRAAPTTSLR